VALEFNSEDFTDLGDERIFYGNHSRFTPNPNSVKAHF
jgi:hypothetical protein